MKPNTNKSTQDYTEIIRALTPICLALIGGLIGIFALISPEVKSERLSSAMGLAGTAIAGGSGIAQSGKIETRSSQTEENSDC